jgi:arylsulfatase
MKRLSEHSVLDIKNRSYTVTAAFQAPAEDATRGVIIAQGGRFGGWALYVKDGRAKFAYNLLGMHEFVAEAKEDLTSRRHQIRIEFAYDGGGLAKGGDVTIYYDGRNVGNGRVDQTQPLIFSADETTDIGDDFGMPVTTDYAGAQRTHRRRANRRWRGQPFSSHRPERGGESRHLPTVTGQSEVAAKEPSGW